MSKMSAKLTNRQFHWLLFPRIVWGDYVHNFTTRDLFSFSLSERNENVVKEKVAAWNVGMHSWPFFLTFFPALIFFIIIWQAPRAGKMNQIARCDWLPERARWSHLARSGLPAVPRKKNFTESHIINPLLTKFVRSRWLYIGLVLFLRVYGPRLRLGP